MRPIILLGALVVGSSAFAQDATFRGNAEHTGVYRGAGVPQFSNIKWQFHTGGQVMSSPAVTADTVYIGSSDHFLYALDRATGAQIWKFKTESRITSSPAVSGGVVYFGSWDGNVYAVNSAKGDLKWKFAALGERRFAANHLLARCLWRRSCRTRLISFCRHRLFGTARSILAAAIRTSMPWMEFRGN